LSRRLGDISANDFIESLEQLGTNFGRNPSVER